eukprot:83961_1
MPSYPTSLGHYTYFYYDNVQIQQNLRNRTMVFRRNYLLFRLIEIILICLLISTLGLSIIYSFWLIYSYANNWWYDHRHQVAKGYFFVSVLYNVVWSLFIVYILITRKLETTKFRYIIICAWFIITFIVSFPIMFYYDYMAQLPYLLSDSAIVCNYIKCFRYDALAMIESHIAAFGPLVFLLVWYCIEFILNSIGCFVDENSSKNTYEMNEILLANDTETLHKASVAESESHKSHLNSCSIKMYSLLFVLLNMLMTFLWLCSNIILPEIYQRKFVFSVVNYSLFHIVLYLFKQAMKYIARKIDYFRMRCIETQEQEQIKHNINKYFSLEYYVEWMSTVLYFVWVRYFIAYHISSFTEFIIVSAISLLSEVWQSSFKFTQFYFTKNKQILNCLNKTFHSNDDKQCICYKILSDSGNCNLEQYRIRIAMDMNIRAIADILSGFAQLIFILCCSSDIWKYTFHTDGSYHQAILFTILSFSFECLRFILTFYYVHKKYNFNIIQPFINYIDGIKIKYAFIMFFVHFIYFAATFYNITNWS